MAAWKMVGLEVTPTTENSSRSRRSSPFSSQSRAIESTQTATPWSLSCPRGLVVAIAGLLRRSGRQVAQHAGLLDVFAVQDGQGSLDDVDLGEPELDEGRPARRRRAEAVDAHHPTEGADPLVPQGGTARLHRQPGRHLRRQDLVAVALVLGFEQLP